MLMDLLHGFEVLSTTEETLFNWILVSETRDFWKIFQSNITIGNKGKPNKLKKTKFEKMPN